MVVTHAPIGGILCATSTFLNIALCAAKTAFRVNCKGIVRFYVRDMCGYTSEIG